MVTCVKFEDFYFYKIPRNISARVIAYYTIGNNDFEISQLLIGEIKFHEKYADIIIEGKIYKFDYSDSYELSDEQGLPIQLMYIVYNSPSYETISDENIKDEMDKFFKCNNESKSEYLFKSNGETAFFKEKVGDKYFLFETDDNVAFMVNSSNLKCPANCKYDIEFKKLVEGKIKGAFTSVVYNKAKYIFVGYMYGERNKHLLIRYDESSKCPIFFEALVDEENTQISEDEYDSIFDYASKSNDYNIIGKILGNNSSFERVKPGTLIKMHRDDRRWYSIVKYIIKRFPYNNESFVCDVSSYINIYISDKGINSVIDGSLKSLCCGYDVCEGSEKERVLKTIKTIYSKFNLYDFINDKESVGTFSNKRENDIKMFDYAIIERKVDGEKFIIQYHCKRDGFYLAVGGIKFFENDYNIYPYSGNETMV